MRLQPTIKSHQNDAFKAVLRLQQASERRDRQLFLVEGTHLIEEAIATGWPLEAVWFEEEWAEGNGSLIDKISSDTSRRSLVLQPATRELLRRLSTTSTRTPVIGIAAQLASTQPQTKPIALGLVVESLQDPGNLGSMIRIAAAAGIGQVVLSRDSVSPTNPKVLRATAGQWFRSPPLVTDLKEFLKEQSDASVQILAACADGISMWELDLKRPTLFLLGNEGHGLTTELRGLAACTVSVPMAEGVESLNVAITSALLIYEALRQRGSERSPGTSEMQLRKNRETR